MSYYLTNENSFLNINNAHLKVSGNVHADVMKIGAVEFAPIASNVTTTTNFTNVETGLTTSSNLHVGGTLTMGTVEVIATTHNLENTTTNGNITPHTVEFTNATTSIVASGNVEVEKELTVSGNVAVSENLTVSSNLIVTGNVTMNGMTIAGNLAVAPPNSSDGTLYYDTTQKRLYILENGIWTSLIGDINNSTSFQPSDITNYYAHYKASDYSSGQLNDSSGNSRNGSAATGVTQRHAWHGEFGAKSYFATLYGTESGGTTGRVPLHPDVLPPLYTIVTLTRRYTPPNYNGIDNIGRVITFDHNAGAATSSHSASAGYGRAANWLLGHWSDKSGVAFFGGWVATNVSSGVNDSAGQYGNTTGSQWLISIGKPGYYASKVQGSDWNTNTISNDGSGNGFKFDRICIGGGTYEPCNWEFAEMIVYNRELNDSEIESLKRHMQAKYNIY